MTDVYSNPLELKMVGTPHPLSFTDLYGFEGDIWLRRDEELPSFKAGEG